MFVDFDLEFLAEIVAVVDRHLATIEKEHADPEEAEQLGLFDRMEHLIGLGFVACQAYMASTYGFLKIAKSRALPLGPRHASGQTVAEIVSNAANYWKHHNEWHVDRSPAGRRRVEQAFASLKVAPDGGYPLSNVLAALVGPQGKLAIIVGMLAEWRDAVRKEAVA